LFQQPDALIQSGNDKANWEGIYSYILHHKFDLYYLQTDVEALWSHLKQVLVDAVEAHVPKFFLRKHQ